MNIIEWIEAYWHVSSATQFNIIYSLIALVVLWVLRYFSLKLIFRRVKDVRDKYYWKTGIKNAYTVLLVIVIGVPAPRYW